MSVHRNTTYPANRSADKPVGGWGKSMHGDSLKPGDVVYGPALSENAKGQLEVLPKHFGVVVASEAGEVTVMYATSEKSYNIAHGQSFTTEDKALVNGFAKDGHWSRTDFYQMPSELLERRGHVSDATWNKIQQAAAVAPRSGSDFHLPTMDRDGNLAHTNGRDAGQWAGMRQALQEVSTERAGATSAVAGPNAEDLAVREAKAEAVAVVQDLLKPDGSEPSYRYSQTSAVELADKIADAPDGAVVVMTPQDKLRVVQDEAGLSKCGDWERMSVADARELIDGEVQRVRAEFAAQHEGAAAPSSPAAAQAQVAAEVDNGMER